MGSVALLGVVVLSALLLVGPVDGSGGETPLAEAGLDQQVLRGEAVRLDATGSYDPDGSVTAYEWRIRTPGGRTVSPLDPHSARTTFPATAVGRYEVRLTVTDDDGNVGTDTMYVLVEAGNAGAGEPTPTARTTSSGDSTGATEVAHGCSVGSGAGSGSGDDCPSPDDPTPRPRVSIDGPGVVVAEHSYTYEAVTDGLADTRTYGWDGGDTGRTHTLYFQSHGEYTIRVTVEDERGRSATDELEVFVSPAENERPQVEIDTPRSVSAGEHVTLSVDARDPDGRILTTEWSPGRRVRVPTDGSSRTVRVTVTDDDDASVTDTITLSGRTWNTTRVANDTTDVTCYFTDERQRDGRNPYSDRCISEGGTIVSQTIGPSTIESWRQNEQIDLHWQRTTEEQLDRLEADDTSTDYGVPVASPYDDANRFGFSDDPVRTGSTGQWVDVDNTEAFTLDDKTVEDDLTGDGEVNAADWDQRYRTSSDTTDEDPHADATAAFKRSIRDGVVREEESEGVFESTRDARARIITGTFAGTSIDAETRRGRIAELSHRTSAGGDTDHDSDERDGPGPSDGADSTSGSDHDEGSRDSGSDDATTPDGAADVDGTDGVDDTHDTDAVDEHDETDDTHDTGHTDDAGYLDFTGYTDDIDDTDENGEADETERTDTGSETDGPSRHSPHGGTIATFP